MRTIGGARAQRGELRRLRDLAAAVVRGDTDAARAIAEGLAVESRPRKDARRLLTLDPGIDALLLSTGSASRYVERLVADAWTEWQEALASLLAAGWSRRELLAACDALNGYAMLGSGRASWIHAELYDAEKLNDLCARHEIDPRVWATRTAQVRDDEGLARALWSVTREWWRGNRAMERAMERGEEK